MKSKEENTYYCIVTGSPKYIPPSLVKNKLKKFGSKDEFRHHYISREARKMLKDNMTVDEIRQQLNCSPDLPSVDPHILARLKLLKKRTRKGQKEAQEQVERARYLNSQQFKDKIRRIKEDRESMTYAAWVEENTGIGKERGGTCIRPDIFLTWNNRACDGCQAYEYCLCHNRRLSHEKRKPKRR